MAKYFEVNTMDRIVRLKEIWESNDSTEFTLEEIILMAELCIEWKLDWRTDKSEESEGCKMFNAILNHNNNCQLYYF
jgi:hypothetical protein